MIRDAILEFFHICSQAQRKLPRLLLAGKNVHMRKVDFGVVRNGIRRGRRGGGMVAICESRDWG